MEHRGALVRLEELWRYVLFDGRRFPRTHPHEHHALQRPCREGTGLQAPDHLGVWPFGDELDTVPLAIEGGPMVCAAQIAPPDALPQGEIHAAMRAVVPEGLHLTVRIPEEHQVSTQKP
jgi:hypothetical protein